MKNVKKNEERVKKAGKSKIIPSVKGASICFWPKGKHLAYIVRTSCGNTPHKCLHVVINAIPNAMVNATGGGI